MKKLVSALTILALLCSSIGLCHAAELQNDSSESLLYLVESEEEKNSMIEAELTGSYANIVDIIVADSELDHDLSGYSAVAVPITLANQLPLITLFNDGTYVYLYGTVTIESFKKALGITRFGVERTVSSETALFYDTVFQEFRDTSAPYQVIGLRNAENQGLLCNIDGSEVMPYEYFNAVVNNLYQEDKEATTMASLIHSKFDIVSYYYNSSASTHLDHLIYKDTEETDFSTNYYAVQTNVWGETSSGIIRDVYSRHSLTNRNDNIYNHQPSSRTGSSYNLSLSLPSGSIGISATFSKSLAIDVSADYTNDVVTWSAYRATPYFGTGDISNEVLSTGTSWATGTGNDVTIDLSYRSTRTNNDGNTGMATQSWQTTSFTLYQI